MRRLNNLNIDGLYGNGSIRTSFTYDSVGNITSVARSMNIGASPAMLNGTIIHTYEYDPLYRLIKGEGHFGDNQANYSLDMSYDDMYRITSKKQDLSQSNIQFEGTLFSGYDLDYAYNTTPGKRFQMASVSDVNYRTEEEPTEDDAVVENHCYKYDNNGNIICVNTSRTMPDVGFQSGNVKKMREERFRWDEENRLLAISQNGYMSHYWYDADGERVVKEHGASQAVFVNSEQNAALTQTEKYAVYPSPFFTYTNGGIYTRHIYIGSERIASQVSNSLNYSPSALDVAGHSDDIRIRVDYERKREELRAQIDSAYSEFDLVYQGIDHDNNDYDFLNDDYWNNTFGLMMNGEDHISSTPRDNQRDLVYFYHRDHLGSSTAVSNDDGKLSQQVEYLPYGEVFLERQRQASDYLSPYRFNSKELDEETGLYYYGARYMNPRLSIWYATDPLQEKYPNISSYCYTMSNPIALIDVNGEAWKPTQNEIDGTYTGYQWIPEEQSYDKSGKLLPGLYEQAIFFSNEGINGKFDPSSNYNIGTSTATVYKSDGTTSTFNACTYPSDISAYATIPEGIYEAKVGIHNRKYEALRLSDIGTVNFYENSIELGYPNPSNKSRTTAQGINIHRPGKGNLTGIYNVSKAISEGCILIDENQWNSFMGVFNKPDMRNSLISVTVSRSMSSPSNQNYRLHRQPKVIMQNDATRVEIKNPFKRLKL